MKRVTALLLALLLLLPALALAEEDDVLLEDLVDLELEEGPSYGNVPWDFPLALEDMDPELIRLANKHYLLASDYVPAGMVKVPKSLEKGGLDYAVVPDGSWWYLKEDCAAALSEMASALYQEMGKKLYLKSAYRAYSTQRTMYRNRLANNGGKDDGWVSMPGASDHQTGLGCDVVPYSWRKKSMNDKMMQEPECQWMAAHCQEYGFIIRYPADKKAYTEINTEPWHIRYVGLAVAQYIMENGLCLEEFHQQLAEAMDAFVAAGGDEAVVAPYRQTLTD